MRPVLQRNAQFFAYSTDKDAAHVGFNVTEKNIKKIKDIYYHMCKWKTVYVNIAGTDVETMSDVEHWFACWVDAHLARDKNTYCAVTDYDPDLYIGVTKYRDQLKKIGDENIIQIPQIRVRQNFYRLRKPVTDEEWRLTLPCRAGFPRWINPQNPQTFKEQIHAAAVAKGCDKCPFYDINRYEQKTVKSKKSSALRLDPNGLCLDLEQLIKEMYN